MSVMQAFREALEVKVSLEYLFHLVYLQFTWNYMDSQFNIHNSGY